MSYIIVAPLGDNPKALFIGMKEFPTEKVILITPINKIKEAKKLEKKLEEFTIKTEIIIIEENLMEEMFRIIGSICSSYPEDKVLVNVATGDRMSTCAALSAAFANGLKAFGISNNKPMLLPIMKLSYYQELSENKLKILKALENNKEFIRINELSKKLNMSISLLSYHINGNFKYKGLKEFRLVDIKEEGNSVLVKLSQMGKLLLKGYIRPRKKK